MTGQLSLWQEGLLLGLAALSFVYVFYFRIWLAFAVGSDLLFALALAVTVASITYAPLFETAANRLIDRSALPAALDAADAKVAAIEALPGELIDRALAKIGVEREKDPAIDLGTLDSPGPFVASIRPSVDALLTTSLRLAGFFCGTFLMLTALAMRASTTTARKLQQLAQRMQPLEERFASEVSNLDAPPPSAANTGATRQP